MKINQTSEKGLTTSGIDRGNQDDYSRADRNYEPHAFSEMHGEIDHHPSRPDIDPALLEAIFPIIMQKGLKATTMDIVAKNLRMSKRTLYEIFESKKDMIFQVIDHNSHKMVDQMKEIVETSPNVMAALFTIFAMHRDYLGIVSTDYFRDMDRLYPEMRRRHESCKDQRQKGLLDILQLGVRQGVFRDDVNFEILVKIVELQSEALKRAESIFPAEITLLEIYDTITIGFLRSIASAEGHRILDDMRKAHKLGINI